MTMISENWGELLAPGLRKVFQSRMRELDELFKGRQIFPQDSTARAYEDYLGVGGIDSDMWNEFERTGRTSYGESELGWRTRLEPREFTGGIQIRRKLIEDNLYTQAGLPNNVTGRASQLATSLAVHHERSAAALFNNAFTDSGLDDEGFPIAGADGVGLCSTAHRASPTNSTTQSNEGVLALTSENVRATRLAMRKLKDDRGNPVSMKPDTLLVPVDLEDQALKIVRTAQEVGSANNDVNLNFSQGWNVISWDYLADANAWFMIDSVLKNDHLVWLTRNAPEFHGGKLDESTMIASFTGYSRYSRGFDAWQWIYGNNPS